MALLLMGSGASALVYQVVWTREFRLIFGGSTSATAAVLAVFTLGLGAGALLLGKLGDRSPNPLRLYGRLEIGVTIGALLSPGLLTLARSAYLWLGGEVVLGPTVGTALRLVLTALVLLLPTVLMGGTLPAAAAAVGVDSDPRRLRIAVLYGVNTLGAVAGSLLSTFVALERLGTVRTLVAAALLNAIVAMVALVRARALAPVPQTGPDGFANLAGDAGSASSQAATSKQEAPAPRRFVLAAAFVTGFVFFVMELVWYRMLSPILGGTVFTFGLILATVLLGIGVGGAAYSLYGLRGGRVTLRLFAWTCALEGLLILLPFAAGDRLAVLAVSLRGLSVLGFGGAVAGWAVVAGLVAFPAAVVAGFQFPLMIALLGSGRRGVSRDTASAYVWNMAGGILGSLVGGFGALPLLTAPGAWRLAGAAMVAMSLAATLATRYPGRGPFLALSFLAFLPAFATGPTAAWRHSQIGAGRSGLESLRSGDGVADALASIRRSVLWEADGVESSVALRVANGVTFVVNGKVDGHATLDAPTQVMAGVLGALLHPDPRSAMVIGLGTGGTAGWLGVVPGIERVDVSELEPRIVDVARFLAAVNENVVSNPKVKIHQGDAREFLQTTPSNYDIVVSEPSNPYRAGIASLFSREYYQQIGKRLKPGGLFVQWLQTYEIDLPSVRRVFATVLAEFPHVQVFRTHRDLLLLASAEPWTIDRNRILSRLHEDPFSRGLASGWWVADLEGVLAYYVGGTHLARVMAEGAQGLVTDDRNPLEFGFARSLGRTDLFRLADIRLLGQQLGESLPPGFDSATVSLDALVENSAEVYANAPGLLVLSPEAQARYDTGVLVGRGRLREGYERWRSQSGSPVTLRQNMFAAEAEAEMKDALVLKRVALFPKGHEGEVGAVLARYFLRAGDGARAVDLAVAALVSMARTPWGETGVMGRLLDLLPEIAAFSPSAVETLGRHLQAPFAGGALYEERIGAWLNLSLTPGSGLDCREPLRYFERGAPTTLPFLQARVACFTQSGDPRLAQAQADLAEVQAAFRETRVLR